MKRPGPRIGTFVLPPLASALLLAILTSCAGGRAASTGVQRAEASAGSAEDRPNLSGAAAAMRSAEDPDDRPGLTLEDLFLRPRFYEVSPLQTRWAAKGASLSFLWPNASAPGTSDLVSLNLDTGERTTLVDGARLDAPDVAHRPVIEDYEITHDGRSVLLFTDAEQVWREKTRGFFYLYDLQSRALTPIADRGRGSQMFAKLSPDGGFVGFVRNRNLFLREVATGREIPVTSDDPASGLINGTYDWVYEEEFRLRDGWRWSPDGRRMAFVQLDESLVPEFSMADLRPLYPEIQRFRYPKAGEKNSEIRIGTYDLATRRVEFFDTQTWNAGGDRYEYLVGLGWTPPIEGVSHVWTLRLNRDQNRLELLFLNPANGEVRVILEEAEPSWVEVEEDADWTGVAAGRIRFLDDGRHFMWVSETSGYRHLTLHSLDGRRVRVITEGPWDVTGFHGVVGGQVYFSGSKTSSLERHAWKVSLTGGEPTRITGEPGWNEISLSPDGRYVLHRVSTPERPTVTAVRSTTGAVVWMLEDNRALADLVSSYGLKPVEYISVPAGDGTPLDAYLIKPSSFDSTRSYPLLIHVYAGPGSKEVARRWGGVERLWHHFLAEEYGVLVAGIDGRGTGYRGKAFRTAVYRQLGLVEAEDQIAAARTLAARPWVDADRIGIWGWSYGGTMALMSMLVGEGPATFKVGMSVAPVTDWRLYDTIYTERYMSTPENNPDGYARSAATAYAGRLGEDQALLIVHGDLDDNVHVQNTVHMIDALQDAGKEFEMEIYPGTNHRIAGGNRQFLVYRSLTRFLEKNLLPGR